MLKIVCVNADNYCGRGKEYVEILHNSVLRNLKQGTEGQFICFTNDPEPYAPGIEKQLLHPNLTGWWHKLWLFSKGLFDEGDRIVYFDLDTVITSGLDEIVKYTGDFAILRDFYRPSGLQSAVMMWKANKNCEIWNSFETADFPSIEGGDQAWIEERVMPHILQDLYPRCFRSYKKDCGASIPKHTKVVVFHGIPRPHQCGGWVPAIWRINGGSALELENECNVSPEKIEANIRYMLASGLPHLETLHPLQEARALIIGGGPSLAGSINEIRIRQQNGEKVFATNNTYAYLQDHGITADYHLLADSRPENLAFVPKTGNPRLLYASHCDPSVIDYARDKDCLMWHVGHDGMQDLVDPDRTKHVAYIAGGSTVGMVGMSVVYALGYRRLHLFGFDSCYAQGQGHAYPQSLNDKEVVMDIQSYGRDFKAAAWMIQQANEFCELAPVLVELGCQINVHGDGLIRHISECINEELKPDTDTEIRDGIYWPKSDIECHLSVMNYLEDLTRIVSHCDKFDTAVQAGGNVGMWPRELATKFRNIYTFEPDPINFFCLNQNVRESNVIKLQAAVGCSAALIKLATKRSNCGAHFVDGSGNIPTLTIDSLGLESCDLIQLDVEGFEFPALKGAIETIRKFKPVIVCEEKNLGEKYGIQEDDIGVFLQQFGYKIADKFHRDVVYKSTSGE